MSCHHQYPSHPLPQVYPPAPPLFVALRSADGPPGPQPLLGPAAASWSSPLAAAAGFAGLSVTSLTDTGRFYLTFAAGPVRAPGPVFRVVAAPPAAVRFTELPGPAGAVAGAAFCAAVAVTDAFGNPAATAGLAAALALLPAPGVTSPTPAQAAAAFTGGAAVATAGGAARFCGLVVALAGQYTLAAAAGPSVLPSGICRGD